MLKILLLLYKLILSNLDLLRTFSFLNRTSLIFLCIKKLQNFTLIIIILFSLVFVFNVKKQQNDLISY